MRRIALSSALVFLAANLVACGAPEAPANPSWDTDVYPILRGSCLGCHGETSGDVGPPAFRMDFCDPMSLGDLRPSGPPFLGAAALSGALVTSTAPSNPKRMPPPPAAPLSDYDMAVLKNWSAKFTRLDSKAGDACKKGPGNRRPTARLLDKRKEGSTLFATIEIIDADGDQVLGKAIAGSGTKDISAGRHEVAIDNVSGSELELKFTDGYEVVSQKFGF